ncbi:MAG: type II toxin-antitoxin system RelE/ParE family toxin [Akkermansiaceae bacterium]|nr:type II toxin-antitoxin system RelE/ParE family toxin [Akkermansiaceae bacterium]
MRSIVFHRRAARYLSRMPRDRAVQVRDALREVAALDDISSHPAVKSMAGAMAGWSRLRVGSYRAILQVTIVEIDEVLYVDAIGPRGDIYKG